MARNKGKKPSEAHNKDAAQSDFASKLQKAKATINSIPPLEQSDAATLTLPDLDKDQVTALDKAEPEKKIELEKLLVDISEVAKRVRDLHEDAQKRTEDLARKEEAFSRRSDENKSEPKRSTNSTKS
jgi:hypothetical protein